MFADLHKYPARVAEDETGNTYMTKVLSARRDVVGTPIHRAPIFAALSPKEKGFFTGVEGGSVDRNSMQQLYEFLATTDIKNIHKWIDDRGLPLQFKAGKKKFEWLRDLSAPLPDQCASFLRTGQYDYFAELKQQYKFYRDAGSQGVYALAMPGCELNKDEAAPPNLVFAIHGIHALGIGNPEDDCQQDDRCRIDISMGRLKSRIQQIKGEAPLEDQQLQTWEHPPFLFRLAQDFGNGVFGHAKSFPDNAGSLFDQRRSLNKGVIKACGYEIVRELLGLDEHLQRTGSRRILIDLLHLSAASRNDLYEKVYRIYNKNIDPANPIPVVFAGAAYSGIDYLIEMMKNANEGCEHDNFRVNGYFGGGINLSDEDVLAVFWSNGLIALSLEERKLGDEMGGLEKMFATSTRSKALRLLSRQITGIISIPFAYHLSSPLRIWDCLSIGTNLGQEGTPLAHYRSATSIQSLMEDVEQVLSKMKKDEPMWFGGYKPCVLSEKLCSGNITTFTSCNF